MGYLAFQSIVHSSLQFSKYFRNRRICFNKDAAVEHDLAYLFDTGDSMYKFLDDECGVLLEDKRMNPSHTYYVGDAAKKEFAIRDYKGYTFDSVYSYVKHRIVTSYAFTTTNIKQKSAILSKRMILKYHLKIVYLKLHLNFNKNHEDQKDSLDTLTYAREYKLTILPRRMKRFGKLKKRLFAQACEEECNVCHKHTYVTMDQKTYWNPQIFVTQLMICPCKELVVCSKRCQKIAWNKLGHRLTCKSRIIV